MNSRDLTEDNLEKTREAIFKIGMSSDSFESIETMILNKLSDQIYSLRVNKNSSFPEIAAILKSCGLDISATAIKEHYAIDMDRRIHALEQFVVRYNRLEWHAGAEKSAAIEKGLRHALKSKTELKLHYQPQINMQTGKVVGAEALIRWELNGTLVSPVDFIPVAEATGLIVPIGNWIIKEACREAMRWQKMGLGDEAGIKVGVNLSVQQISPKLVGYIHGILCDTGLPINLFGLEITESFLVHDDSQPILNSLSNSGIHLSIDDFGTGYSCLSLLHKLPLDTIKIDRAFVKDVERVDSSLAVLKTIMSMAKTLKMDTLAEGVETIGQKNMLVEMGCSVCQGFFYSMPLRADEFVEYSKTR